MTCVRSYSILVQYSYTVRAAACGCGYYEKALLKRWRCFVVVPQVLIGLQ